MTIRVSITTSDGSLPGLEARLAAYPVRCERLPLLEFETLEPPAALRARLEGSVGCDAVACTSPRAAAWLAEASVASPAGVPPVWVSGERTAAALERSGLLVHRVPVRAAAGSAGAQVAAAVIATGACRTLLHVTGEPHRPELAARCRDAGISVIELVVYRSVPVSADQLAGAVAEADLVVVGSPVLAEALATVPAGRRPGYVALGPVTAAACAAAGLEATTIADTATAGAVAEAILHAARRRALPLEA